MIQLQAVAKPKRLTDDVIAKLTQKYKDDKTNVWKKKYITKSLLIMSADKCCFCETKLQEESKYMEVEHFHPKKLYPDEVISWDNLLPICKRCNVNKLDHDTVTDCIIHPVKDNPKEHLKLSDGGILRGTTPLGKRTVIIVKLNKNQNLDVIRDDIRTALGFKLIDLLDFTKIYCKTPSDYMKDKIIGNLKRIMQEGTREYEYSATAATVILTNPDYTEIKRLFTTHNLWDDEFIQLERDVEYCALI